MQVVHFKHISSLSCRSFHLKTRACYFGPPMVLTFYSQLFIVWCTLLLEIDVNIDDLWPLQNMDDMCFKVVNFKVYVPNFFFFFLQFTVYICGDNIFQNQGSLARFSKFRPALSKLFQASITCCRGNIMSSNNFSILDLTKVLYCCGFCIFWLQNQSHLLVFKSLSFNIKQYHILHCSWLYCELLKVFQIFSVTTSRLEARIQSFK